MAKLLGDFLVLLPVVGGASSKTTVITILSGLNYNLAIEKSLNSTNTTTTNVPITTLCCNVYRL